MTYEPVSAVTPPPTPDILSTGGGWDQFLLLVGRRCRWLMGVLWIPSCSLRLGERGVPRSPFALGRK